MNDGDKARMQALVQELDQLVPRTDAVVLLTQYGGGCDESQITATETGYLRMGIELLKAPFLPQFVDGEDVQINVDLEYLISEQSDVNLQLFHINNSLRPDMPYSPKERLIWKDRLSLISGVLLCGVLVWVFDVGLVTLLRWAFR